jgi:hypothetical protein
MPSTVFVEDLFCRHCPLLELLRQPDLMSFISEQSGQLVVKGTLCGAE